MYWPSITSSEIFSVIVDWMAHPPKVKYCTNFEIKINSFEIKYFTLGGSCRLDGTPSQSEIFSVIVVCIYFINSCGTFVQ